MTSPVATSLRTKLVTWFVTRTLAEVLVDVADR